MAKKPKSTTAAQNAHLNNSPLSHIDVWKISDLVNALSDRPAGAKIKIPQFQRSLVWRPKQKEAFLSSLRQGFPCGSMLLYRRPGEKEEYILIDGLQRTTTLKDYMENPAKYFTEDSIDELVPTFLDELCAAFEAESVKVTKESASKIIRNHVDSLSSGFADLNWNAWALLKTFKASLNLTSVSASFEETLMRLLLVFHRNVTHSYDLSDIELPVIKYHGPENHLPTIFDNLNSKGTKLNKYEVFAASWYDTAVPIKNKQIVAFIKERYDDLIKEGLKVDGYDPYDKDFAKGDFSLYEYLFGFGKMLAKENPVLFGGPESKLSESIGFNLVTVCLGIAIPDMRKLPTEIKERGIELHKLEQALVACCNDVQEAIKGWVSLKASAKKDAETVYHSDFQIMSFITKLLNLKFDAKYDPITTHRPQAKSLLKNLPAHYLYDIIRGYWRGSGNSKLILEVQGNRYLEPITQQKWEFILDEWLAVQMEEVSKGRRPIGSAEMLFQKYIYTGSISHLDDATKTYHMEHIVPVARLEELINGAALDGLPINSVANQCLLPAEINLEKGKLTIYEYYNSPSTTKPIPLSRVETQLTFTKQSDLEFVSDLTADDFKTYLDERGKKLKSKFFKAIKDEGLLE